MYGDFHITTKIRTYYDELAKTSNLFQRSLKIAPRMITIFRRKCKTFSYGDHSLSELWQYFEERKRKRGVLDR